MPSKTQAQSLHEAFVTLNASTMTTMTKLIFPVILLVSSLVILTFAITIAFTNFNTPAYSYQMEHNLNYSIITDEIEQFYSDFYSGRSIDLDPHCLQEKETGFKVNCNYIRINYTVDNAKIDGSLDRYDVELFCNSLTNFRTCIEKEAKSHCGQANTDYIIKTSWLNVCRMPSMHRFYRSFFIFPSTSYVALVITTVVVFGVFGAAEFYHYAKTRQNQEKGDQVSELNSPANTSTMVALLKQTILFLSLAIITVALAIYLAIIYGTFFPQSFDRSLNQTIIGNEIQQFHSDFFNGRSIPLGPHCLKTNRDKGKFNICFKAMPLSFMIDATTMDYSLNVYDVETFCKSLAAYREMMIIQAKSLCGDKNTYPDKTPYLSLCHSPAILRFQHAFFVIPSTILLWLAGITASLAVSVFIVRIYRDGKRAKVAGPVLTVSQRKIPKISTYDEIVLQLLG